MSRALLTLVIVMVARFAAIAGGPDDVLGVWLVEDRDAKVEIYKTSKGNLEGKVVWLKDPNLLDIKNPDEKLKGRKIMGTIPLWGFIWNAEDQAWEDGKVYKSKNGKTYCGKIKLNPDGTLYLKGNICGITFLSAKNTWTRTTK